MRTSGKSILRTSPLGNSPKAAVASDPASTPVRGIGVGNAAFQLVSTLPVGLRLSALQHGGCAAFQQGRHVVVAER
jgi:hypothetical protein